MFYITISNGLLEAGHRKRMGPAVWEFMWCIDKVTRIDEDGTGWVLGGKPIKLIELATPMGVDEETVSRNLIKLEEEGYIIKTRTPCGIVIKVVRAKKRFGKNVESDSAKMWNRGHKNVESNIRHNKDNAEDSSARKRAASEGLPEPEVTYGGKFDAEGNEIEEGAGRKKAAFGRAKRDPRVMAVVKYFTDKAVKYTGKPVIANGYSTVHRLLQKKGVTEEVLKKVVDGFFEDCPTDDRAGNLYICFSVKNINKYIIGS